MCCYVVEGADSLAAPPVFGKEWCVYLAKHSLFMWSVIFFCRSVDLTLFWRVVKNFLLDNSERSAQKEIVCSNSTLAVSY